MWGGLCPSGAGGSCCTKCLRLQDSDHTVHPSVIVASQPHQTPPDLSDYLLSLSRHDESLTFFIIDLMQTHASLAPTDLFVSLDFLFWCFVLRSQANLLFVWFVQTRPLQSYCVTSSEIQIIMEHVYPSDFGAVFALGCVPPCQRVVKCG